MILPSTRVTSFQWQYGPSKFLTVISTPLLLHLSVNTSITKELSVPPTFTYILWLHAMFSDPEGIPYLLWDIAFELIDTLSHLR